MNDPVSFSVSQLDRLQSFFPRVEGKASFLFAMDVALLASIAVGFPIKHPFALAGIVGLVAAGFIVLSLVAAFRSFFPHLAGAGTLSVFYFRDIAEGTADDYRLRLGTVREDELLEDIACQVWRNSKILTVKFNRVERAFWLTGIGLVPWAAFLAMSAFVAGKFVLPG